MSSDSLHSETQDSAVEPPRIVAVIDIGSTSVRMQISELHGNGQIRNLESFSQAVSLGKDSFVRGSIKQTTIEDCVRVLRVYRQKLDEYGITDEQSTRVIATSAVKEARNRLAFQDRIFIATGFAIEPFDEAELHRVTYLGLLDLFQSHPQTFKDRSVVCEVGGGTTEILLLSRHDVSYSQTLRLGAIRLRTALDAMRVPEARTEEMLRDQVTQIIRQLPDALFEHRPTSYVAMGSEVRFAAKEILRDHQDAPLVKLDRDALARFTAEINRLPTDSIATRYHFSIPEAETLGPALLTHQIIAEELGVTNFFATQINMRDGMLQEMARGRAWSESIQRQVVRSASLVGQKFHVDAVYADHVALLACTLFDQLTAIHQLPPSTRGILEVAAMLHEAGLFISPRSYHKHTSYLIRHSEFFGIGAHERELVSLVARYHRRATPQPSHDLFSQMTRNDRVVVAKLSAILRIAIALNASRKQKIRNPVVTQQGTRIIISTQQLADLSLEQLELSRSASFFEDIFGCRVVLRAIPV